MFIYYWMIFNLRAYMYVYKARVKVLNLFIWYIFHCLACNISMHTNSLLGWYNWRRWLLMKWPSPGIRTELCCRGPAQFVVANCHNIHESQWSLLATECFHRWLRSYKLTHSTSAETNCHLIMTISMNTAIEYGCLSLGYYNTSC